MADYPRRILLSGQTEPGIGTAEVRVELPLGQWGELISLSLRQDPLGPAVTVWELSGGQTASSFLIRRQTVAAFIPDLPQPIPILLSEALIIRMTNGTADVPVVGNAYVRQYPAPVI